MTHPEKWKYEKCYDLETYRMGPARLAYALNDIGHFKAEFPIDTEVPEDESPTLAATYLDVGCGRGETLIEARKRGLIAWGTELVDALIATDDNIIYGELEGLPFDDHTFDYVTCYDVLEHLIPGHEQVALDQLGRVCRKQLIISTNNRPSHLPDGTDLHINKRDCSEWAQDIHNRWHGHARIFFKNEGHLGNDWHWRIVFDDDLA